MLDDLAIEPGAFYLLDRGYLDFARLFTIHQAQAFFVTRAKSNTKFKRRYSQPVDRANTPVLCDQTGVLTVFYSKAHRVQLACVGRQADLDVAQALAPGQLRKGHGAKLLGTRQHSHARSASILMHDARKARPRYELHDLGEQGLANIHVHSSGTSTRGKYAGFGNRSSSRHQPKSAYSPR